MNTDWRLTKLFLKIFFKRNIFLTVEKDNWVIKLGDFGIAKKFGTNSILLASTHAGTSAYMSPEIIAGGEDYDFKADVWYFHFFFVGL